MASSEAEARRGDRTCVVEVGDWAAAQPLMDLEQICAVFIPPPSPAEPWRDELASAIESGRFTLSRTELADVEIDQVAGWLETHLPRTSISQATRDALLSDLLDLLHIHTALTGAMHYHIRIFVEPPTRRCGFHVDTVAPGLPVWGMLRAYNGAGTVWAPASSITSMTEFYRWLNARDRVVRRLDGDRAKRDRQLEALDRELPFLDNPQAIAHVSAGTTVIFRHLDASLHWCDHSPKLAWLHCSPCAGPPRLVVNVSAARAGAGYRST